MSIVSRTSPPFGDRGQATAYIGETVNAGFRLQQPDGAGGWELQDYSGRVFGLRVYSDGGTTLVNVLGTLTAHADGAYIACNIPGTTTDDLAVGLYGWEFVEFVADGRLVIAGGPFKVATASAAAQASGSSGTSSAGSTVYTLRTDLGIVAVNYMGAPGYSVPTGGTVGQYVRKSSSTNYDMAWDTITSADVSGLDAQLAALQAADADLAVIAALTPSNDDLLQRKAGAWANRTPAQVKTDLALVKGDVGLGNVDNTSDANKPVSTAQQAALDLKLNLAGGTLSGVLAFVAGTAALPGLAVAGDLNTGIYGVSADVLGVTAGGTARVTVSASGLMPFADATYDLGSASTRFYAGLFSNSVKIGGAAPAGAASLSSIQSFGSNWSLIGGDVLTDATTKRTRHGYLHYLAAEEPVTVYLGYADATQSIVSFGGGTSSGNAATRLEFWTAANNSTITGTQRWFIDSAGFFYAAADNSYDFGAASSARARSIYAGTNVVIGYSTTSSAQLHVGAGGVQTVRDGAGSSFTPMVQHSVTSGVSGIATGVVDGTNNYRAALFVDNTNGVWGLSGRATSATIPFIIYQNDAERFRLTAAAATLYGNLLFGTDNSFDVGAVAANRPRSIYVGTAVYTGTVGTTGATALSLMTDSLTRFYISGSSGHLLANADNTYDFGASGANRVRNLYVADSVFSGGFRFPSSTRLSSLSDGGLRISNNAISNFAILEAEAANTLALRNGVNAQALRVYSTYTDASNYERLGIFKSGSSYVVLTEQAGTGTALALRLGTVGAASAIIRTNNVDRFSVDSSGHYLAAADNTYDIGASGSSRPRNLYLGGTIATGGSITSGSSIVATTSLTVGAANGINWTGRSVMRSPADGVVTLADAAETGFGRLCLGPATASFAALRSASAVLEARLGNNSAYTGFAALYVQTPALTVATLPAAGTAGAGARAFVTDATATTFLSTVAGGGANKVPVVSDGTNWLIG